MSIVETLEHSPIVDQLSEPVVEKWNILVSQTNWEKGKLILSWRGELIAAGLPNTAYSDEAWARRVGKVSPQHVGKLRRVTERFGETNHDFPGLYWSHFNAALDWNDAELWLEGAVQNDWSVAQMRIQRWEALGGSDEQRPGDEDIYTTEIDEDVYAQQPDRIEGRSAEIGGAAIGGAVIGEAEIGGTNLDAAPVGVPDSGAVPLKQKEPSKRDQAKPTGSTSPAPTTGELLISLNAISQFPSDFAEPLELLKVAILNQKLSGWKSVPAEHVRRTLDTLKMLTVAED